MSCTESPLPRKPPWLKVRFPSHENYFYVSGLLRDKGLNTICRSAQCPNVTECWSQKTATFLILGDVCTRNCSFCAVSHGYPLPPAADEPDRIVEAVLSMGLRYVVITSVTRDDLPDGGASKFAETVKRIRVKAPGVRVEVLIPDFGGNDLALRTVIDSNPDIVNHNLEVPESMYPAVNRARESYGRSLKVLASAKDMGSLTKSGLMIGLGEKEEEILQAFSDLRRSSCDLLTIGQYLQPSRSHLPVKKYFTPVEFDQLRKIALDFGFEEVVSGPLVRSSYMAHQAYTELNRKRRAH